MSCEDLYSYVSSCLLFLFLYLEYLQSVLVQLQLHIIPLGPAKEASFDPWLHIVEPVRRVYKEVRVGRAFLSCLLSLKVNANLLLSILSQAFTH